MGHWVSSQSIKSCEWPEDARIKMTFASASVNSDLAVTADKCYGLGAHKYPYRIPTESFSFIENVLPTFTCTNLVSNHTFRSDNMREMQCLYQVSSTKLLMGGHQDKLLELDLTKMKETVIVS